MVYSKPYPPKNILQPPHRKKPQSESYVKWVKFVSCLVTLLAMAADAPVTPPAAATPTPTAVRASEAPSVSGDRITPAAAATPPAIVVAPPVMPAIFVPFETLGVKGIQMTLITDVYLKHSKHMKLSVTSKYTSAQKVLNYSLNGFDLLTECNIHDFITICGLVTLSKLSAMQSSSAVCFHRKPPCSDSRRI